MFCQRRLLSPGALVIAIILSAQLAAARESDGWFSGQPQNNVDRRGAHYEQHESESGPHHPRHHGRHGHHGHHHHGHHHGHDNYPNQFHAQTPQQEWFSLQGGYGGAPGYGQANHPRPGYGGSVQPYPLQPRPDQGAGVPFGFQQPDQGPPGKAVRPLQPRPVDPSGVQHPGLVFSNGRPLQPRPGQEASDPFGYQQPDQSLDGIVGRPLQPRPQQGPSYPGGFQQSGSPLQPRPDQGTSDLFGYQQPDHSLDGNVGRPLQPRPGQGSSGDQQPDQSLDGNVGRPLQPRPGQDSSGDQQPDQSLDGSVGRPLQPRPDQGISLGGHPTDNVGSTLQPRPEAEPTEAYTGNVGISLQPRPTQGHVQQSFPIGLQHPSQGSAGNPLQPRPEPVGFSQGDLFQPHQGQQAENLGNAPAVNPLVAHQPLVGQQQHEEYRRGKPTDHMVDENIMSIFNTKDFLSPQLKEDHEEGTRTSSEGGQPKSIDGRFLLSTDPKCEDGKDVRGGRCRQSA